MGTLCDDRQVSESSPGAGKRLQDTLKTLGQELGGREAKHRDALARAEGVARTLHASVSEAAAAFREAAGEAGSPHLSLDVSAPVLDQKHVRAYEFEVRRGRTVGIVTAKVKGEVTLVGPFRRGKNEGPCRSFSSDADAELYSALEAFLLQLAEEANSP